MSQPIPPLVIDRTENEYYDHFCRVYCSNDDPIYTFDGRRVDFYPSQFKHTFKESANRVKGDKSVFSQKRAERIDWIKWALQNSEAELFQGWDKNMGCFDPDRRVCIVIRNYVVVIQIKGEKEAFFVTAFSAEPETLRKIRNGPKWR